MKEYEVKCASCGKRLYTYSQASFRHYKSPVKACKKCGTKYADYRCQEIAVEGLPNDTFKKSSYLIMSIIGGLIFYRGIYLLGMHQLGVADNMQWLMPTVFMAMGLILFVGGIIEIITIVFGIKQRKFDRLTEESVERLSDRSYAEMLATLGYDVPDKYLN